MAASASVQETPPPAELDDASLVAAYRGGADAAFAELVRRHQIPVFRLLLGLTSDADEAELCCEQVFFEAARRLGTDAGSLQFGAWLLTLAREVVRKAEEKRPKASLPKRTMARPRDPKALVKHEVRSALRELTGDERVALILADLEGDSFESIAQALGTSPSEAEQIVNTARTKFEGGLERHSDDDEPAPKDVALAPGTLLGGRFRIESLLGRGGMGAVYRATDTTTGQPVALKTLLPAYQEDAGLRRRFAREAEIIQRLQHPNFVRLIEYAQPEGQPSYVAMELIAGDALKQVIQRESRLPPLRALHIAHHVLNGLEYAHGQGVIHRDLKPENVMLVPHDADPDFAKVLDLGIAKLVGPDDARRTRLTQQGELMGTPLYISPEMLRGEALDARADLYSLTVMLFEMLTARPPFESATATAVFAMHLAAPPPSLAETAPDLALPAELEQLLQQGLAKEPARRIPSAEAYLKRVEELLRLDWDKLPKRAVKSVAAAPRRRFERAPGTIMLGPGAAAVVVSGPPGLVARLLRALPRSPSARVAVVASVLALLGLVYWMTRDIAARGP